MTINTPAFILILIAVAIAVVLVTRKKNNRPPPVQPPELFSLQVWGELMGEWVWTSFEKDTLEKITANFDGYMQQTPVPSLRIIDKNGYVVRQS